MPWIQNIGRKEIENGWHLNAGSNSMLIQILDPSDDFPKPKHEFKEIHQFQFLDIEGDGLTNLGDGELTDMSKFAITDEQATEIASLLKKAFDTRMNVIVHCFAGVCRSGAVTEVGVMLGFQDSESFRNPNLLVKHKLLKALNMPFDPNEKPDLEAWRKFRSFD